MQYKAYFFLKYAINVNTININSLSKIRIKIIINPNILSNGYFLTSLVKYFFKLL